MPGFDGPDSPSLHKMEMNNGRYGGERKGFNFSNIAGDPFSLATIGIALVGENSLPRASVVKLIPGQCGWIIAFVSSVIADIDTDYPNFCWWTLAYMLAVIVGVIVTVATNTTLTYHVAMVGFLAAGLVFTTSSVNSLIYYPEGSKEAGAAGFILLSMVAVSKTNMPRLEHCC